MVNNRRRTWTLVTLNTKGVTSTLLTYRGLGISGGWGIGDWEGRQLPQFGGPNLQKFLSFRHLIAQ